MPAYSGLVGGETNQEILKIITQGQHIEKMKNLGIRISSTVPTGTTVPLPRPFFCNQKYRRPKAARHHDVVGNQGYNVRYCEANERREFAIQLGIEAAAVDATGNPELSYESFDRAIDTINNHLISVYRQRNIHKPDPEATTWGKVLVFCESGNERSAAVVAAYLMAMYHLDLVSSI